MKRIFNISYTSKGRQILKENDNIFFIGKPVFKFISIWQKYSLFRGENQQYPILEIDFKCFSNHYFVLKIDYQNFNSKLDLHIDGALIKLMVDDIRIKFVPNEYVINKNFLNIEINEMEIGKIYRNRLKLGSPIYTIIIEDRFDYIDYVLALCMLCLNNYE